MYTTTSPSTFKGTYGGLALVWAQGVGECTEQCLSGYGLRGHRTEHSNFKPEQLYLHVSLCFSIVVDLRNQPKSS